VAPLDRDVIIRRAPIGPADSRSADAPECVSVVAVPSPVLERSGSTRPIAALDEFGSAVFGERGRSRRRNPVRVRAGARSIQGTLDEYDEFLRLQRGSAPMAYREWSQAWKRIENRRPGPALISILDVGWLVKNSAYLTCWDRKFVIEILEYRRKVRRA
jgi:hypothetical protein